MAVSRPYAALRILAQWPESADKNEFVFLYFSELVENVSSVFYTELARNQGMTAHGYEIPPTNRLLHFFLLDAKVAQQFRLYKPVGDFVERHLDELQRHPEQDFYNRMPGQFDDEERNRWPVYAAVRFFDIMITQALYQGIEWHMWLYYFPPFVERMLRNYQSDSGMFDPDAEFPLRYSKLLYEVFDVLRDWILALEQALLALGGNVVLVAHGLGCHAVAWWAATDSPLAAGIQAAMLVAPPDIPSAPGCLPALSSFTPMPQRKLPCPS